MTEQATTTALVPYGADQAALAAIIRATTWPTFTARLAASAEAIADLFRPLVESWHTLVAAFCAELDHEPNNWTDRAAEHWENTR